MFANLLKLFSFFLIFFFTLGGLSKTSLRIAPEYDNSRSIVYSFGNVPLRPFYYPGGYVKELVDERMEMYRQLVNNQPGVEHIFVLDGNLEFKGKRLQEIVEKDVIGPLRKSGDYKIKLFPGPYSDDSWPDEWSRDFVSLSLTNGNELSGLLARKGRGDQINNMLAKHFDVPILGQDQDGISFFENGNFMSDSNGRCYTSELYKDSTSDFENYCTEITYLPNLDLEGTKHIDLFAKIISPTDVIVTKFSSDKVGLKEGYGKSVYQCTDEQIKTNNWFECRHIEYSHSSKDFKLVKQDDGKPLTIPFKEIVSMVRELYPKASKNMEFSGPQGLRPISEFPNAVNWIQHFSDVRKKFTDLGFNVIDIENQTPFLKVSKTEYQNTLGEVVREELSIDLVFRSYANSLVTNNRAFVPVYPLFGDAKLDKAALDKYKSSISTVFPVKSDYAALGGGTVHCLTHQIAR